MLPNARKYKSRLKICPADLENKLFRFNIWLPTRMLKTLSSSPQLEKYARLDRGKLKWASECLCGMVTSSSQNDNLSFEEFQIAYEIPLPTNTFIYVCFNCPMYKRQSGFGIREIFAWESGILGFRVRAGKIRRRDKRCLLSSLPSSKCCVSLLRTIRKTATA